MALTPFDMEGVNRDLLAAGNPAKPDMQSILRRNARDLVLGNAILVSSVDAKELEFGVHMAYSDADGGFDTDPSRPRSRFPMNALICLPTTRSESGSRTC